MRVFKSKVIREQLTESELSALIEDFKQYKLSKIHPIHLVEMSYTITPIRYPLLNLKKFNTFIYWG